MNFLGLVVVAILLSRLAWPPVKRALSVMVQERDRFDMEQRQSQLAAMRADLAAMREEFRSIESRTSGGLN